MNKELLVLLDKMLLHLKNEKILLKDKTFNALNEDGFEKFNYKTLNEITSGLNSIETLTKAIEKQIQKIKEGDINE